jgi:dTMP kinase
MNGNNHYLGNSLPGVYIALEGIRGCGKSTQTRLLGERIKREYRGRELVVTKEPGGTEKSGQIREVIVTQSKTGEKLLPGVEVKLFAASREQTIATLIKPALERGAIVVSDRSVLSSLCYQGFGLDLGWQNVWKENEKGLDGVCPDLIIVPDISPELSAQRVALREQRDNVYDSHGLEYYKRVRDGYLFFACMFKDRIFMIDGSLPIETQAELIWEKTGPLIEGKRELIWEMQAELNPRVSIRRERE